MLYNLRSDIIYYKSSSDFELEFNLCGCCRMRLLTDKPSNKKAFVHSLARAVSRSRVILIAGAIFGEENTIQIVAQALSTTTEVVDNNAYNIASDEEIEIIKGSIPLVSSDGSFGGCIIESGPQTMILLTDNKTLRKNIMSTLIHPYVSELYAAEMKSNNGNSSETAEVVDATSESVSETLPTPVVDQEPVIEEDITEENLVLEASSPVIPTEEVISEDIIIEDTLTEDEVQVSIPDINADTLYTEVSEEPSEEAVPTTEIFETQIILEATEEKNEESTLKEDYQNVFNNLYLEEDKPQEATLRNDNTADGYQMLYDNGDIMSDSDANNEGRTSRLNIATIIVTVILLLSIIVLCICIFSASSNEGMAPTEYIRSVWQAVFG
ncbi:MAG: hypothetical protein E7545_04590 [Ruminococcaceae bacterium]|nr:hypothetical protein [Oscillospiraceae bacterium]